MANVQVEGKALYMEMRSGSYTMQMILTPEGFTTSNKLVPLTLYRRRISRATPRKTWKQITAWRQPECDASGTKIVQVPLETALSVSQEKMSFADALFSQLVTQGWTLFKQPIAVEVTREDLDDIRAGKTPYKIIARITRCRAALGFGTSLFA